MQKAREDRPGGRTVTADEIGPTPEPFQRPLICEFCTSPVEPVRGYKAVPGLFRLAKNAAHRPECELNPHEFIKKIARGSHGLAHAKDGILRKEPVIVHPYTPELWEAVYEAQREMFENPPVFSTCSFHSQ